MFPYQKVTQQVTQSNHGTRGQLAILYWSVQNSMEEYGQYNTLWKRMVSTILHGGDRSDKQRNTYSGVSGITMGEDKGITVFKNSHSKCSLAKHV